MKSAEDLAALRDLYSLIYRWHRERGLVEIKRRYNQADIVNDRWFHEYRSVLSNLLPPDKATTENISSVAHHVLAGCMEWSYCEEVAADVTMAAVAKQIRAIVECATKAQANAQMYEALARLKSVGPAAREPEIIQVTLPLERIERGVIEIYSELASKAYGDVIDIVGNTDLGGVVALADCNYEKEMDSPELRQGKLRFRNAAALHLKPDETDDSIVQLVKSGVIKIDSVQLGSFD